MDDDDDLFANDDLDGIPDSTLQQLEQNAFASTQRPKTEARPSTSLPRQQNGLVRSRSALSAKSNNLPWRPPQLKKSTPSFNAARAAAASAPSSSDYGFDEEDVVNLAEPRNVPAPGQDVRSGQVLPARQSVPSATARYQANAPLDPETEAAFAAADAELGAQTTQKWREAQATESQVTNNVDVASLLARVAELEAEQDRLRRAEQNAREAVAQKQGEIAIVRANHDKSTKEYERRIAVMQKLHADAAAKTKAELEAGRKEREKIETDNRFLQHDLAQEAERVRRLSGHGKAWTASGGKEKETPRKPKRMAQGDGFDDNEVLLVSPSKSRERVKDATPRLGNKRKRTVNDSPIAPLSFDGPVPQRKDDDDEQRAMHVSLSSNVDSQDARYEFMQRLLIHSTGEGHERTLEALSRHAFPADPGRSLATILTNDFNLPAASEEAEYPPLKLTRAAFSLWSECITQKHFAPLYLLVDLVQFAMYYERSDVVSQVAEEAIPLCIRTLDPFASTTARALINPTFAATLDISARTKLRTEICGDEMMELLLTLAQAAELDSERITTFWRIMEMHFMLLMLHRAQPLYQITMALRMLATSALETTSGPITDDLTKQIEQEQIIVDRLTCVLFENPEPPPDEPPYTDIELAELRTEVLLVMKAFCKTEHGGTLLAQHKNAIGRLVRFVDAQVNRLYSLRPAVLAMPGEVSAHELVAKTINLAMQILYHLMTTYEEMIDINAKMATIFGGWHKFLLSMTRIAFSEQMVIDHGISDDAVEAAHAILNNSLTMEEGEELIKALETPRGSKVSEERLNAGPVMITNRDEDMVMGEPG